MNIERRSCDLNEIMRPWMWGDRPAAPEQIAYAIRVLGHIAATGQPYTAPPSILAPSREEEGPGGMNGPLGRLQ